MLGWALLIALVSFLAGGFACYVYTCKAALTHTFWIAFFKAAPQKSVEAIRTGLYVSRSEVIISKEINDEMTRLLNEIASKDSPM